MLSGISGIGGGIFLSPIILFACWGNPRQFFAAAAAFIVVNSISGLLGRVSAGTFLLDGMSLALLPLGVRGALTGSYLGAQRLTGVNLRRALGMVMLLAVSNFWLELFNSINLTVRVLIRGSNEIASATAITVFRSGYAVVMHASPNPPPHAARCP